MASTPDYKPKDPWPLRVPKIGNSHEEFLETAAKLSGYPKAMWEYPFAEPHYYEFAAAFADPELSMGVIFPMWIQLQRLICGDDAVPQVSGENGEVADIGRTTTIAKLHKNPNFRRFLLMLEWMFNEHVDNEYWRVLLSFENALPDNKNALLASPDNENWTEDERLTLKFIAAAMERRMTDELWEAAVAAWGQHLAMRYIMLVSLYYSYSLLLEACGHSKWYGPLTP